MDVGLSGIYDQDQYHLRPKDSITYRITSSGDCDECGALQFETRGTSGPRRKAKTARVVKNGPTLRLCAVHAERWRERDDYDRSPNRH